jgi:serine O-acetyltransferase
MATGVAGARAAGAPARQQADADRSESEERRQQVLEERRQQVFEESIEALSKCGNDALSQAVCPGIVDPDEAVAWVTRADRVLRFQSDRSLLRSEVPTVAERLEPLLAKVDLPPGSTPRQIAMRFIGRMPAIRALLAEDVEAALEGDPAARGLQEIVLSYPAIRALSIHRIAHELHALGVPLLPRIISEHAHDRTGIDIHPGATIGRHFFIDHGTGVVIGETAVVGDHVRIYQGVTLGAASLRDSSTLRGQKRHPTVEDNVTIYAGTTILGGDTVIGTGSVIGGNVWITESVPPGSQVVAEPARYVVRQSRDRNAGAQLYWDL